MRPRIVAWAVALAAAACAGEEVDLGRELGVRDLLGVAPPVAARWDATQRAGARQRIERAAPLSALAPLSAPLGEQAELIDAMVTGLRALDGDLERVGEPPILVAAIHVEDGWVVATPASLPPLADGPPAAIEWIGWEQSGDAAPGELARRGPGLALSLAVAAGHDPVRPLRVRPASQQPFVAVYVEGAATLLVNPVALAVLDPRSETPTSASSSSAGAVSPSQSVRPEAERALSGGNPYSFYGSVGECAAAQRLRCDGCLPSSTCEAESRDAPDGNAECETLAAEQGRGYYLFCANLALAIGTVSSCVDELAGACPQVTTASNQLLALDANAAFVDDPQCRDALDRCLERIYGEPADDYPPSPPPDAGPGADGGPPPPPPPPRDVDIDCGDQSCDFSPQVGASCGGGSCDNSASCGSCEGDGCDGDADCGGCEGGGDGGGGDSSCDSSCDSGGSDSGGCDSGGCDSGGCDSGGCDSGGCDSGCDSGSCDSGSCDSGCSSSCRVAEHRHTATWATAAAVGWVLLPFPVLIGWLRRERRRRNTDDGEEGTR